MTSAVLQRDNHRNRRGVEIVLREEPIETGNAIRPAMAIAVENNNADLRQVDAGQTVRPLFPPCLDRLGIGR
jgi:hypothetical protein